MAGERDSSLFTPQMATVTSGGPGQSQKPGAGVATLGGRNRALAPATCCAALPGSLEGSWITTGAARIQNSVPAFSKRCSHVRDGILLS